MSPEGSRAGSRAVRLLVRSLCRQGGARLQVQGRCMEPMLHAGDWIEVTQRVPLPGEFVLAESATGDLVCHRMLMCSGAGCRLAADRSLVADQVPWTRVLGTVVGAERRVAGQMQSERLACTPRARRIDSWLARLQLLSIERRDSWARVPLERARRVLLRLRASSLWGSLHMRVA